MICIIDYITILICSVLVLKSIIRIFNKGINSYYILILVFYAMQVFPLFTDIIYKEDIINLSPTIYKAMIYDSVSIIYDCFVIVVSVCFYRWGMREENNPEILVLTEKLKKINYSNIISFFFYFLGLLPIFCSLFAPNPLIYTQFATFYRENTNVTLLDALYFKEVIHPTINISLIAIVALYARKKKNNLFEYLLIFIILWISQKRAFIFFAFGAIIFLDLLQKRYKNSVQFIRKTLLLIFIAVGYFIIYSNNTIKNIGDESGYSTYVMYGTRHYCMKTAIYDSINSNEILDYPGQSILYDLFFFVPRSYWNEKPVMYQRYFTSYVTGIDIDADIEKWLNLLVNIWTEFISNFGIVLGILLSLSLIRFLINISKHHYLSYIAVTLFLSAYLSFGFEPIVMLIYVFWLLILLTNRRKRIILHL